MAKLDKLYITATSLLTPVGDSSEMTAASISAGVSVYHNTNFYSKKDKPFVGALIPDDALPPLNADLQWVGLKGDEKRCIRICHAAISNLIDKKPLPESITLLLAGPENIPARRSPIAEKIIAHIKTQSGAPINLDTSRIAPTGRAGVLQAIHYAFEYLSMSDETSVLVGGVDTYCNTGLLSGLDVEDRVLNERSPNGFAFGEGAGFLLLSKHRSKSGPAIAVTWPGISDEKGHRYSGDPYLGEGLSDAVATAVKNTSGNKIDTIYSSMNGESFFSKEHGVVMLRNSQFFGENCSVEHPADSYGDLGAATGAVLIALSAIKLKQQNYSPQYQHLICCSSDMSVRSAVCVAAG